MLGWLADPVSASIARRFVADVLLPGSSRTDLDAVVLLTSEVVTNAVVHAGTPIDLVVLAVDRAIQIEVFLIPPYRCRRPLTKPTIWSLGRGLNIVTALSEDWGVTPRPRGGKTGAVPLPVAAALTACRLFNCLTSRVETRQSSPQASARELPTAAGGPIRKHQLR